MSFVEDDKSIHLKSLIYSIILFLGIKGPHISAPPPESPPSQLCTKVVKGDPQLGPYYAE